MTGKKDNDRRFWNVYAGCALLAAAAFAVSLSVGKYPVDFWEIGNILTGKAKDAMMVNVFFTLRLPRTMMAFLAGFGLSLSGFIYQSIFRNSLAAPDLIGVSSGANAGAAFSIVCLKGGAALATVGAFAGGLAAMLFAILFVGLNRKKSAADFVLAGIAVKALADSFVMAMKYMADPERQLASIDYWIMGSFSSVTADKLLIAGPIIVLAFFGLFLLRWQINILILDDDEARMLGVPVHMYRQCILIITTLMTSVIVSVTGSIAFIGLIAPHIARMVLKKNSFAVALAGGLFGGFIIIAADILARMLAASEIPVSILTSVIGVPVLLWLLSREGA